MSNDWEDKLRRLGVVKGARKLRPQRELNVPPLRSPRRVAGSTLEQLVPNGQENENSAGCYFVIDHVYPAQHRHGMMALDAILTCDPTTAAPYSEPELSGLDFGRFLCFDVETTGLAGAGAWAHTVSAGFFEADSFVVRQLFARNPGEEAAILLAFDQLSAEFDGLITFNGRHFDVPLTRNRYFMNRMLDPFADMPNLDLMFPARRLWHRRLGSYSLHTLEDGILGLSRDGARDIEGALIPIIYNNFVRDGDATDIARMLYRNQIDILSLAVLGAHVTGVLGGAVALDEPLDLYSLARWQLKLGMVDSAEKNLRRAAEMDADIDDWHRILLELGALRKRQDRRAEAVPLWQQVAFTTSHAIDAHVELAKYYEWHARDLDQALSWTVQALELVAPNDWSRRQELEHRANRIRRKQTSPRS
jgi:uncharacterized protein YprB with RNaseH-like and TPR domain